MKSFSAFPEAKSLQELKDRIELIISGMHTLEDKMAAITLVGMIEQFYTRQSNLQDKED
jgi:hypothetical protein